MVRLDVYEILKEAVSDGLQRIREVESPNKPITYSLVSSPICRSSVSASASRKK